MYICCPNTNKESTSPTIPAALQKSDSLSVSAPGTAIALVNSFCNYPSNKIIRKELLLNGHYTAYWLMEIIFLQVYAIGIIGSQNDIVAIEMLYNAAILERYDPTGILVHAVID
jgi:hypothetical protein